MRTLLATAALLFALPALAQAQDDQDRGPRMERLKKLHQQARKQLEHHFKAACERLDRMFKERAQQPRKMAKNVVKRIANAIAELRRDVAELRRDVEALKKRLGQERPGRRRDKRPC
ncbi:MAG: hypothetical protein HYY16_08460 [Planctomycetes bacterium]|nr:hypothetical protein [Planctomycetota bacterium]